MSQRLAGQLIDGQWREGAGDQTLIHVNDATIRSEKQSGVGRLNGVWSLDAFTTFKWVSVNYGRRQFPY